MGEFTPWVAPRLLLLLQMPLPLRLLTTLLFHLFFHMYLQLLWYEFFYREQILFVSVLTK